MVLSYKAKLPTIETSTVAKYQQIKMPKNENTEGLSINIITINMMSNNCITRPYSIQKIKVNTSM